jgi:hypothetical protein
MDGMSMAVHGRLRWWADDESDFSSLGPTRSDVIERASGPDISGRVFLLERDQPLQRLREFGHVSKTALS